jgi:tetratricopeptide (TPR) repeat protein
MQAFRLTVVGLFLSLTATAAPVPPANWTGKVVYLKQHGIWIIDDPKSPEPKKVARLGFISYRVLVEKDGWIKIHDKGHEGWIARTDVVPVEEAAAFFTKKIEENPKDVNAYYARAAVRQTKGDLDGALADMTETIRLRPNLAENFVNRGQVWAAKKDDSQAIKDFDEALRINPRHVIALGQRGLAWMRKKDYDKAIADFTEAIGVKPDFPMLYRHRATVLKTKQDFDRALADFEAALRLNPKDALCWNDRGTVWTARKEFDKAIEDFTESIKHDRQSALPFYNRGRVWKLKKDYQKALNDLTEACTLNPKYTAALNLRAWVLATCPEAKLRDGTRAIALAKKACELTAWKNAVYMDTLATACAESGDFDEAIKWQQKANDDPEYARRFGATGKKRLELYKEKKPYREEDKR